MIGGAAAAIAVSLGVAAGTGPSPTGRLASARQLVVVTTADWNATSGTLRRFERRRDSDAWSPVGAAVPIVVGRTGLALGAGFESADPNGPAKHEGDGKAPAGAFPLDTAFGFAPRAESRGVRLPYVQLTANTDCVDDSASAHYNTVVDKQRVRRIDWASAEHMRAVSQYELGVIVGYNARHPVRGRGSCIFLHIWSGPGSSTVGCTALDAAELRTVVEWLDPRRKPVLVQLPSSVYERVRARWALPDRRQQADRATAGSTPVAAASAASPPTATGSLCGARLLNVTLRRSAFATRDALTEPAVRGVAEAVLAPIRASVLDLVVSPAIRAVRIRISDTASVERVITRIRASSSVEDVSRDDCSIRIQRPGPHAAPPR